MSRYAPLASKNAALPSIEIVSGTSIWTNATWSRFQIGSNSPLANRSARMLSTDSLPKKWSIRKTWDSSKLFAIVALSARAEARSWPKGFSQMTRAFTLRPHAPSISTIDGNADGGTARW